MKNFVQSGETVTLPAPVGGITSGDPMLVGSLFGVAAYSAAAGASVEVQLVGVFDLPADGPIDQGAAVYWDDLAGKITAANSGTFGPVGAALLAVGEAGTTCRVRLNGTAVPA